MPYYIHNGRNTFRFPDFPERLRFDLSIQQQNPIRYVQFCIICRFLPSVRIPGACYTSFAVFSNSCRTLSELRTNNSDPNNFVQHNSTFSFVPKYSSAQVNIRTSSGVTPKGSSKRN